MTPLALNLKLAADSRILLTDHSPFRRLVGKLNFLQHTQPNISFSVQHLSQFLNAPMSSHMEVALYVLQYLVLDPTQGILLNSNSDFFVVVYSDSDWATYLSSRHSVTDFFISLGGSPIS